MTQAALSEGHRHKDLAKQSSLDSKHDVGLAFTPELCSCGAGTSVMATPNRLLEGPGVTELVGRDSQCEEIRAALERARKGKAACLWVVGSPGSGKTALCRWVTEQAVGFARVTLTCVEGEGALALSGLLSVLRSLRRYVDDIQGGCRTTLNALLGGQPTQGLDAFAVGASALALLTRAAEDAPLLVCVDDAHWLDEASGLALGFAFRRLDADSVAVMMASRHEARSAGLDAVAQTLRVGGLDEEAGRSLLERSGPIAPHVAAAVVAATGGLPLALTEVAAQLDDAQRSGRVPLPNPLQVSGPVLAIFEERFARLGYQSRMAVAAAAAAGSATAGLLPALQRLGLDDGTNDGSLFEAAEEAGLITVDRYGVAFRHPLVRSAALSVLPAADRRRVHAALAEVTENPERRAAHLLASAAGVSVSRGDALEAAAMQVGARLGSLGAAAIWRDAALLTPPGARRLSRLRLAIPELAAAGLVDDALRFKDEVLATSDDPVARAEVMLVTTWLQLYTERAPAAAEEAMVEAASIEDAVPELARQLRIVAALGLITHGSIVRSLALAEPGKAGADVATAAPILECTWPPIVLALVGRVAEANTWLPPGRVDLCAELLGGPDFSLPVAVAAQAMGLALVWLERPAEAARIAASAIERLQADRRPRELPIFYVSYGQAWFWQDRWDEAAAAVELSLTLADETGQQGILAVARALGAPILGWRGDLTRCLAGARLALDYARQAGSRSMESFALHALGVGCLLAGDIHEALAHLRVAARVAAEIELANPVTILFRRDLCEALVRGGDLDQAEAEQAVLAAQAHRSGLRWPAAISSRVAALLADVRSATGRGRDGDADALFRTALSQWPNGFEGARTRLCWAESLARQGRIGEARPLLLQASSEFARLGARPFLERSSTLLQAAGDPEPAAAPGPLTLLTGAELQVAFAVADGLSNRDIAARLFISPKTVEHHLTHVFQKLHVRSRTDLARVVLTDGTRTRAHPT